MDLYFFKMKPSQVTSISRLLAFLCFTSEVSYLLWSFFYAPWDPRRSYPFQLCDFLMIGAVWYLVFRSQIVYEFLFFWGPPAFFLSLVSPVFALQGSLFYEINFYLSHFLILVVPLWGFFILGDCPRKKAPVQVFLYSHALIPIFYGINQYLGANYMFVMELPPVTPFGKIVFPYTIFCHQLGALVTFWGLGSLIRRVKPLV